ncbi:hypothetical protein Gogos_015298 [Gossypium gossypioides]|uniref:Zinc knuckle CX2CX4HX4C domain-containing protein n=1 Tax=Gossypium gossypioides TaxID=34282 RepID=A0A7J9C181_GOSGO|nr:hypothetical protein [Gossypium gossypioides]
MAEDIKKLLASLTFSKDESKRVVSKTRLDSEAQMYNIPFERMDRQVAIDVGEVVAIDWRDRDGCYIEYLRVKVNIDISKPLQRVVHWVGNKGTEILCGIKYERLPTFCYSYGCIGYSTQKCLQQNEIPGANKSNFQYGNWLTIQLSMPN